MNDEAPTGKEGGHEAQSDREQDNSKLPPIPSDAEIPSMPSDWACYRGSALADDVVEEVPTLPFLGRPGYLAQGDATLIASYPKAGKTTLLAALIPGFVRSGNRVLLLTEERLRTWATRIPADESDIWARVRVIDALGLGGGLARLKYEQGGALLTHAQRSPEEVVVVDTLRNILGLEDETDSSKVVRQVSPWIAGMRNPHPLQDRRAKTFIALGHEIKEPGAFGRGIAGGHGLLGLFDGALEIERVPGVPNRRRVTAIARLLDAPALLYERQADGSLIALGEPKVVSKIEISRRALEVLTDVGEWMRSADILAAMDNPKPGRETLRSALEDLFAEGEIERDPAEAVRGVAYTYRCVPHPDAHDAKKGDRPKAVTALRDPPVVTGSSDLEPPTNSLSKVVPPFGRFRGNSAESPRKDPAEIDVPALLPNGDDELGSPFTNEYQHSLSDAPDDSGLSEGDPKTDDVSGPRPHEPKHPAPFSPAILEAIAESLEGLPSSARVLDPFAGAGGVHDLPFETAGVEIEAEWTAMRAGTIVGDAQYLPFADETFDAIATSPAYGNRLADHHNASDSSYRRTYKQALGRDLHPQNAGAMQWGKHYKGLHAVAWQEAYRVLRPGGMFVLNIKDHIRAGERIEVVSWHQSVLKSLGLILKHRREIDTPGFRRGANRDARFPEEVLVFLKDDPNRVLTVEELHALAAQ